MSIFDLFSKRQADAAKSGQADVYQYSDIPSRLRVQIEQIALEGIGNVGARGDGFYTRDEDNDWWLNIERLYLREKGLDEIAQHKFAGARVLTFMRSCPTEDWLDCLELIAIGIRIVGDNDRLDFRHKWDVSTTAEKAINEINYRLRQAAVGYQVEDEQLFRVDSQFVHAEVVKPALALLSVKGFEGPRQEFLSAHRHYLAGEHRQAVAMAANALEKHVQGYFRAQRMGLRQGRAHLRSRQGRPNERPLAQLPGHQLRPASRHPTDWFAEDQGQ